MKLLRFFLFFSLFTPILHVSALQTESITGKVSDSENGQPLAFVSVTVLGEKQSVTTDIDGGFRIVTHISSPTLKFSLVGYEPLVLKTDDLKKILLVQMTKCQIQLTEIKVKPGENPAHRIIRKVIDNRNRNNPEKLQSFSYTSYNKLSFNYQEDTTIFIRRFPLRLDSLFRDTADLSIQAQMARRHLFLSEFVSQRVYEHPGKNNEQVVSSRVSGLSDPSFSLLATQMQSFSFYTDFVTLFGKQYLNPISQGSLRRYTFRLEDTLYTDRKDTVFVISYHPRKEGAAFNGLKGVLYINTNGYAIQNVLAEQANDDSRFVIRIQQLYQLTDSQTWFPVQLNTDLLFKKVQHKTTFHTYYVLGEGRSYLSDIKINPDVNQVRFTKIALEANKDAAMHDEVFWHAHRSVPLSHRDSITYHIVDSIGRANNFDRTLKKIEAILMGNIPIGPIDLNYKKTLKYNEFEGLRMGLSMTTNQRLAKFFLIGGFASYGFTDAGWKYGTNLQLFPSWNSPNRITFSYSNDMAERGALSFYDDHVASSTAWLRNLLVFDMDAVREREVAIAVGSQGYVKMNLYLNLSEKQLHNYAYQATSSSLPSSFFQFTEVGLNIKFGFREQFIKTPQGNLISLGTNYPMLWINIRQGLSVWDGQYEYTKYELKLSKTILSRRWGKFQATGVAGMVNGNAPLCNLYNGNGSYRSFTVEAENSFATMNMDEFYSDRFASLYLKQNFGALFGRNPFFAPEVCLVTNLGTGRMDNQQRHISTPFNTLEKGYYESGFLLNKLMGILGFGVFYRYGPYHLAKESNNFAYKLTLNLKL